jgi:hypothetical protein
MFQTFLMGVWGAQPPNFKTVGPSHEVTLNLIPWDGHHCVTLVTTGHMCIHIIAHPFDLARGFRWTLARNRRRPQVCGSLLCFAVSDWRRRGAVCVTLPHSVVVLEHGHVTLFFKLRQSTRVLQKTSRATKSTWTSSRAFSLRRGGMIVR